MILSVGESRPKKFKIGASVIKAVEGTDHTHSFVSWRDENLGIRKVAEARGGGGRIVINTQFREENYIVRVFQYEIDPIKLKELEIWIWENLRPYGYKHNLGLGIMRIQNFYYELFNSMKTGKNPFKDGLYSQICVEMTARAIALATGLALPGNVEDYGLREMHTFNYEMYRNKRCELASDELLGRINAG